MGSQDYEILGIHTLGLGEALGSELFESHAISCILAWPRKSH